MTERAPKIVENDVIIVGIVKYTIMIQQTAQVDRFKQQLRESLQHEMLNSRTVKIARHANVYTCGDQDEMVYFIESGQIKLLMLSPEGKQCLLAIHSAGDIFGELCLFGLGARLETATAMEETNLKKIPRSQFLARLSRDSLLEGFVKYLAVGDASKRSTIIMIKKPKSRFTSRNGEGLSAGRQPNF